MERKKDPKILAGWIQEALNEAIKKGFNRRVEWHAYHAEFMDDKMCFFTIQEDKEQVKKWIVDDLLLLEQVCKDIDSGKIFSESSLRRMVKCALW